jgi:predicted DNA-binding protein (MmcQ/YjbR family)
MKQFHLKSKISNETLSKFVAESYEQAVDYFSKIKKLSKKDLLNIFLVTDQV